MPPSELNSGRAWTPLAAEDVLPDLLAWQEAGLRTALVTLVHIDGATPRPLGAQMAVAEDGRFTGYLSGGCIEEAVALEAKRAIAAESNHLVRYGRGSKYVDIKLPCGSGLDLYIDRGVEVATLREAAQLRARRVPFHLEMSLDSGTSRIVAVSGVPETCRDGDLFKRAYMPALHVLLLGSGPQLAALAHIASAAGLALTIATNGDGTRSELAHLGFDCLPIEDALLIPHSAIDCWSAAVLAFHDHDLEVPLLQRLLATDCFYIGALGSRASHGARRAALEGLGATESDIQRVRGPIGLIAGAKSRGLLSLGVIAEILAEAKARNLIV